MDPDRHEPREDVAVVIRSAGERTEALCYALAAREVIAKNILVIRERPFSKALKTAFQCGIDNGLPWTLCLDADVLPRSGAIGRLIGAAGRHSNAPKLFKCEGHVLCKVIGGPYPGAGGHLYKTASLPQALRFVTSDKSVIRPETVVREQMERKGYVCARVDHLFGLHDYEQFYHDLYRKLFVRARKSRGARVYLLRRCLARMDRDADFRVMAWGLLAGMESNDTVSLDAGDYSAEAERLLQRLGLQEKGALRNVDAHRDMPDRVAAQYVPSNEYLALEPWLFPPKNARTNRGLWDKVRSRLREKGTLRFGPWALGETLRRAGILMKRAVG